MNCNDLERYITAYKEVGQDMYSYELVYKYLMHWKDDNTFKVLNLIEVLVDLGYDFETILEILEIENFVE